MLLLRSVVAPLLLIGTVILSFLAALGASTGPSSTCSASRRSTAVPLLAFVFLVALGVDYNIFLITRAREETPAPRPRAGDPARRWPSPAASSPAPASCSRRSFAVLGVLPLVFLTQIGVVVGFGVLLDTLLVRTVLVPALVNLLDRRVWWPRRPQPRGRRRVGSARPRRRHAGLKGTVRGGSRRAGAGVRERGHSLCAG